MRNPALCCLAVLCASAIEPKYLREELARAARVVKAAGIKPE